MLGAGGVVFMRWWLWVPPTPSDTEDAVRQFTRVLNGDDALRQEALSALAGALARDSEDGRAQLWFGLANMYLLIEEQRIPYAIRATRALERAAALDPGAAGWNAFWRYKFAEHSGRPVDEHRRALYEASAQDPEFTPFLLAIAVANLPLASGHPQRALQALEALEDCGDGTSHSCRAAPLFPHGAEGFHATLGDLYVRVGQLEDGARHYRRALATPSAGSWPYRQEFETWIQGAERRATLLTNDDPDDDPTIFFASGPRACAACHRR